MMQMQILKNLNDKKYLEIKKFIKYFINYYFKNYLKKLNYYF